MLKLFFILIGFLTFLTLRAQQVTNMKVTQEGDDVVITYDISSDKAGQTFDIKVECSADNGKTFSIFPKSLSGDLKGIKADNRKRIVWDVLSELEVLAGDHFVFQFVVNINNTTYANAGNTGSSKKTVSVTDIEGNVYNTVIIGTQIWMAENLKTTKYRNGTSIPNVTDATSWDNLTTPGYCWYNNDDANKSTYGALYNWHTVNTGKLAPTGWHVPTDTEWSTLTTFLGGESVAGGKLKETGTTHWISPNIGATNEIGFAALPGGDHGSNGAFGYDGVYGSWWSSTEDSSSGAWTRSMRNSLSGVYRFGSSKEYGFSVRCVKD